MSYIITQAELEPLNEMQLRTLYSSILADLATCGLSAFDCPLTMVTLDNIRAVLRRKQALKPPALRL